MFAQKVLDLSHVFLLWMLATMQMHFTEKRL